MKQVTFISPHPDDAALSLGATLWRWARRNVAIHLVTCFTESSWAPRRDLASTTLVSELRAREDDDFLRLLPGATHTRLHLRDVVVRSPRRDRFDAIRPRDDELIARLSRLIGRHRRGPLLLPLGLLHLDHKLVRQAGLYAHRSRSLAFYEDVPYSLQLSGPQLAAVTRILARVVGPLRPLRLGRSPRLRQLAIDSYPSQFDARERRELAVAAVARGGERVWATAKFARALSARS